MENMNNYFICFKNRLLLPLLLSVHLYYLCGSHVDPFYRHDLDRMEIPCYGGLNPHPLSPATHPPVKSKQSVDRAQLWQAEMSGHCKFRHRTRQRANGVVGTLASPMDVFDKYRSRRTSPFAPLMLTDKTNGATGHWISEEMDDCPQHGVARHISGF